MASPPQIQRGSVLNRVPHDFKDLKDVSRWAKAQLRAQELLDPNLGIGVHSGTDIRVPTSYPYTMQVTDYAVLVNTSAPRTINLPSMTRGFVATVKDATGSAGANNITVNPHGAEKIDGAATFVLTSNYQAITFLGTGIAGNEWLLF